MAASGIKPDEALQKWFNEDFKLKRKAKWALMEIKDDKVVLKAQGPASDTPEKFKAALAKQHNYAYALYDDKRIGLSIFAPNSNPKQAMMYASTLDALASSLPGCTNCATADSAEDMFDNFKAKGVV